MFRLVRKNELDLLLDRADSLEKERLTYIREISELQNQTTAASFASHVKESSEHFARIDTEAKDKITKEEYDRRHTQLEQRIRVMEEWRANFTGRFAVGAILGTIVVSTATAFITHLVS